MAATRQWRNKSDGDDGLIKKAIPYFTKIKILAIYCFTVILIIFIEILLYKTILITVMVIRNMQLRN